MVGSQRFTGKPREKSLALISNLFFSENFLGNENVWADPLTGWAVKAPRSVEVIKVVRYKNIMCAPVNARTNWNIDWPTVKDTMKAQTGWIWISPKAFEINLEVYRNEKYLVWIPAENSLLILQILVAETN